MSWDRDTEIIADAIYKAGFRFLAGRYRYTARERRFSVLLAMVDKHLREDQVQHGRVLRVLDTALETKHILANQHKVLSDRARDIEENET